MGNNLDILLSVGINKSDLGKMEKDIEQEILKISEDVSKSPRLKANFSHLFSDLLTGITEAGRDVDKLNKAGTLFINRMKILKTIMGKSAFGGLGNQKIFDNLDAGQLSQITKNVDKLIEKSKELNNVQNNLIGKKKKETSFTITQAEKELKPDKEIQEAYSKTINKLFKDSKQKVAQKTVEAYAKYAAMFYEASRMQPKNTDEELKKAQLLYAVMQKITDAENKDIRFKSIREKINTDPSTKNYTIPKSVADYERQVYVAIQNVIKPLKEGLESEINQIYEDAAQSVIGMQKSNVEKELQKYFVTRTKAIEEIKKLQKDKSLSSGIVDDKNIKNVKDLIGYLQRFEDLGGNINKLNLSDKVKSILSQATKGSYKEEIQNLQSSITAWVKNPFGFGAGTGEGLGNGEGDGNGNGLGGMSEEQLKSFLDILGRIQESLNAISKTIGVIGDDKSVKNISEVFNEINETFSSLKVSLQDDGVFVTAVNGFVEAIGKIDEALEKLDGSSQEVEQLKEKILELQSALDKTKNKNTSGNSRYEQFLEDAMNYRADSEITHPNYDEGFDQKLYNEGKRDLDRYIKWVNDATEKFNDAVHNGKGIAETTKLAQELYEMQVSFVAAYDVLNSFSDYRLGKDSKHGGAKQSIQDLYKQLTSEEFWKDETTEDNKNPANVRVEPDVNPDDFIDSIETKLSGYPVDVSVRPRLLNPQDFVDEVTNQVSGVSVKVNVEPVTEKAEETFGLLDESQNDNKEKEDAITVDVTPTVSNPQEFTNHIEEEVENTPVEVVVVPSDTSMETFLNEINLLADRIKKKDKSYLPEKRTDYEAGYLFSDDEYAEKIKKTLIEKKEEINNKIKPFYQNNTSFLKDLSDEADRLKTKLSPILDKVKYFSEESSVKDISSEDIAKEALRCQENLNKLYEEGKQDSDEFIINQLRIWKLWEREKSVYGVVKTSGAKDSAQMRSWITNAWERELSTPDKKVSFTDTIDYIFGGKGGSPSILDHTGKPFSMRDLAEQKLGYSGWLKDDIEKLQNIKLVLDYIKTDFAVEIPTAIEQTNNALEDTRQQAEMANENANSSKRAIDLMNEIEDWGHNNVNSQLIPPAVMFADTVEELDQAIIKIKEYKSQLEEIQNTDDGTLTQSRKDEIYNSIKWLDTLIDSTEKQIELKKQFNQSQSLDEETKLSEPDEPINTNSPVPIKVKPLFDPQEFADEVTENLKGVSAEINVTPGITSAPTTVGNIEESLKNVSAESEKLNELKESIDDVTRKIGYKTAAFVNEQGQVEKTVNIEKSKLEELSSFIRDDVTQAIDAKTESFRAEAEAVKESVEKEKTYLRELVSDLDAIKEKSKIELEFENKTEEEKKKTSSKKDSSSKKSAYDHDFAKKRAEAIEETIASETAGYDREEIKYAVRRIYDDYGYLVRAFIETNKVIQDETGKIIDSSDNLNITYKRVMNPETGESSGEIATSLTKRDSEQYRLQIQKEQSQAYKEQLKLEKELITLRLSGKAGSEEYKEVSRQKNEWKDIVNLHNDILKKLDSEFDIEERFVKLQQENQKEFNALSRAKAKDHDRVIDETEKLVNRARDRKNADALGEQINQSKEYEKREREYEKTRKQELRRGKRQEQKVKNAYKNEIDNTRNNSLNEQKEILEKIWDIKNKLFNTTNPIDRELLEGQLEIQKKLFIEKTKELEQLGVSRKEQIEINKLSDIRKHGLEEQQEILRKLQAEATKEQQTKIQEDAEKERQSNIQSALKVQEEAYKKRLQYTKDLYKAEKDGHEEDFAALQELIKKQEERIEQQGKIILSYDDEYDHKKRLIELEEKYRNSFDDTVTRLEAQKRDQQNKERQAKIDAETKQQTKIQEDAEKEAKNNVKNRIDSSLKSQKEAYEKIWEIRNKLLKLPVESQGSDYEKSLREQLEIQQQIVVTTAKELRNLGVSIKDQNEINKIAKIRNKGLEEREEIYRKLRDSAENDAQKEYKETLKLVNEKFNIDAKEKSGKELTVQEKERKKQLEEQDLINKKVEVLNMYQKEGLITQEQLNELIDDQAEKEKLLEQIGQARTKNELSSSIEKYEEKIANLNTGKNLSKQTDEYINKLQEIQDKLKELKNFEDTDLFDTDDVENIKETKNQLNGLLSELSEIDKAANKVKASSEILRMSEFISKNSLLPFTKRGREAIDEIHELQDTLKKVGLTAPEIQDVVDRFNKLKTELIEADIAGKSLFGAIKDKAFYRTAQMFSRYFSLYDWIRYIKQAVNVIRELDTALVDLRKTAKMSTTELNNFYKASNDIAKQMGVTTKEIIAQAAAWSRLGYSTAEQAEKMAALSSQFAAVSPDMDVSQATDGLVSSMKAFGIEVDNVEREVMDNINRIGNTMATTNGEIVDMLTRSSAAMSAANNTIQETIALESAAVEITRNAETTGTAFKTVAMRIRGYDEETEELSEDLESISGDIADLTKVAGKGGISLFTDSTKQTYKSTYQILKEISDIWDQLDDKTQARLLEKLAGKRGAQVVAGVIQNFSAAEKAMDEMANAAGSADAEMKIIEESIDYKLNKFKQTWIGVAQELIDRGDIGKIIDALTSLSNVIGTIVEKIGLLGTAGVGIGAFLGFKDYGATDMFSSLFSSIKSYISENNENKLIKEYNRELRKMSDETEKAAYADEFLAQHKELLSEETRKAIEVNKGEEISLKGYTAATTKATVATRLFKAALNALLMAGVMYLLQKASTWWDEHNLSVEEAISKVNELKSSIETLYNEYDNLSKKQELTPEELARLEYLKTRLDYEEKLYEIAEKNRLNAAIGTTHPKVAYMIDKDSYEYQYGQDFGKGEYTDLSTEVIDQGGLSKFLGNFFRKTWSTANTYLRFTGDAKKLVWNAEKGIYNEDKANETYNSLLYYYQDFYEKADKIKQDIESPYITQEQKEQLQAYLNDYQNAIEKIKKQINDLGMNYNSEWIITPEFDFDYSKLSAPELKKAMDEYIRQMAIELGYDFYGEVSDEDYKKVKVALGFELEPANRKYNAYRDVARFAAEKYGDYTEGYSNGNWQKDYNFRWADSFVKNHKVITDEELALFKQAVEESESKEDVLDKYIELRKQALLNFSGRLSEEQNKEFDEYEETLNKLHEYLQKAHLGELTDADLQELAKDFKDFSISAENYEGQIREIIDTMSGEMPEKLGLVLDESDKVYQRYADVVKEMKEAGVATTDTVFGNINTNNRQVIEWTEETIEQYRDALESWGESHPEGLLGSISTVFGATQNVHGVEIAVSPMLQTDNGAVLLDADTVSDYLENIYTQANGDVELMMKLDKKGVNGIKGLIADIGDTAEETSKKMHYTGALGEYMDAYKACVDEAKKLGITTEKFLDQRSEKSALLKALENITREAEIATKALNDAFSAVKSSSDALKDFEKARKEGTIDESILSTIGGLNDELNTLVAGYYGGVVTIDQLYEKLQEVRAKDFEEYKQAYVTKMKFDENYYKNVVEGHREMFKAMSKMYHTDLENATSFESAKLQLKVQLLGKYSEVLASFYDAEGELIQTKYNALYADAMGANGQMSYEALKMLDMIDRYNKAVEELKKIGWSDFDNIDMGAFDKINADLKNTKSEYEELFDFFERRIEVIDQALNKLDASLENVNGSMSKNILIAGKIGIVSEEIKDYSSALIMYEDQANKELAKLDADLQDKIKNGAVDLTKLMGEGGEEVNKILTEYQNWANKVNDCNQKLLELKETLRDLALDKFNNIVQDFTDEFELIGSASSFIDKQISLFEEAGQIIGKGFYEAQIEVSRKQRNLLEKEKAELINELSSSIANGYIQKGTDEWLEMVNSIKEVDESILDCDQSIEQLQNSILELSDQAFERLQNQFSSLKDQLNNINSLIDEIDVSDEEGVWSKEGMTRLGMFAEQYELARHNVEKYQEQIDQLNDSYANGLYSTTEYLDKLSELTEQQWSEALAAEDAKKSIMDLNKARVDLIKEGIQKQIDKYKELIDAQKEALDQDKDLHDWQKTLAEKNKNITKLQNQIAVLSNDDSASANAKRIKLQQELNEALEDLEETQYDHSIEKQKEALDQQMEDFEDERQKEIDALEEYLKDTEKVQKDSFEVIKNNTNAIAETIAELVKTHGVIVSETITNSWKQGENAIAAYGETLAVESSGFMSEINVLELYLGGLQNEADITAAELANIFTAKADNLVTELNSTRDTEMDLINATNMLQNALIKTLEGGYDNSRIINSLREIQDEINKTIATASGAGGGTGNGGGKGSTPGGQVPSGQNPGEQNSSSSSWNPIQTIVDSIENLVETAQGIVQKHDNLEQRARDAEKQLGYLDEELNKQVEREIKEEEERKQKQQETIETLKEHGRLQTSSSMNATKAQDARNAEEQAAALKQQAKNNPESVPYYGELWATEHAQYSRKKEEELSSLKSQFAYAEYYNVNTSQYSAAYEQLARGTQYSKEAAEQKKKIDYAIADYKARQAAILQKYSGYAVGVHKLKADELAWTQELGQEAILSPTRNAILTKLNKGDTVLTAEQTDNLFKLSKIDPSTIFGKLKMPTYSSKTMTPVLTIGNVLTVNGNIDDTNVDKMKGFVNNAITKAFKDFSSEIIKR